ncbi:MAG TPA: DUF1848 domain-containing protein [Ktedonobacterales bacterium]|nr:DUF1848 domain-containing protein [Ktedonobacterales bacterium]
MIISASYKTDIPAFYGEWFMRRLRAGSCQMVNPYNGNPVPVNLKREPDEKGREGVDGFVFWSKNIGPFLRHLPEIRERGYPFVAQHTINGYPRQLEARVVNYDRAVANMHRLATEYGPKVAVWRYDPILITSLTPPEWHRDTFAKLAGQLRGATDEVVISLAQVYKKTARNMDLAAKRSRGRFTWREHEAFANDDARLEEARALVRDLAGMARANGMTLTVCSQKRFEIEGVVGPAHCIEADRLANVAREAGIEGKPISAKVKGNRPECACSASRDIGDYDTCPHGCVYCYAVTDRNKALDRYRQHDPASEFLFTPESRTIQIARPPIPKPPRTKVVGGRAKRAAKNSARGVATVMQPSVWDAAPRSDGESS